MNTLSKAIAIAALATTSLTATPSTEVIRVREWRAKNERQIVAELIQLV